MIYCFKKLKAIKKLYVFFAAYACSALIGIGFAVWRNIANAQCYDNLLPFDNWGLQVSVFVILYMVYIEPTYIILRFLNIWTLRYHVRNSDMTLEEKIESVPTISAFAPVMDGNTIINAVYICFSILLIGLFDSSIAYQTASLGAVPAWETVSMHVMAFVIFCIGLINVSALKKYILER